MTSTIVGHTTHGHQIPPLPEERWMSMPVPMTWWASEESWKGYGPCRSMTLKRPLSAICERQSIRRRHCWEMYTCRSPAVTMIAIKRPLCSGLSRVPLSWKNGLERKKKYEPPQQQFWRTDPPYRVDGLFPVHSAEDR